jgi:hypothetical protein
MFFQELVEQHRVHGFVPKGVHLALCVAHHEIGIDLFHVLSHEPELRSALGIDFFLVTERERLLRKQSLDARQMSRRLADVLRRLRVRVLGDLQGRQVGDFAWKRNCGFDTLYELDLLTRRRAYRAVALRIKRQL